MELWRDTLADLNYMLSPVPPDCHCCVQLYLDYGRIVNLHTTSASSSIKVGGYTLYVAELSGWKKYRLDSWWLVGNQPLQTGHYALFS